jgi:hypothetical protein
MSAKEEFLDFHNQLQDLKKEISELSKRQHDIIDKRDKLASSFLLEEAILSEVLWNLGSSYAPRITCARKTSQWTTLADLFETDYHCYIHLDNDTTLAFNDGEITITFKTMEQLAAFIKLHDIKLAYSHIQKTYNKAKKDMEELEPLIRLFKS